MTPQETEEFLPESSGSMALRPGWQGARLQAACPLFRCWPQVSPVIRRAQRILLLLDFDGTLAPLCDRPEDVQLGDATRQVLRRLTSHRRITVAVVSGRRRDDLRERIGIRGVQYFGLHGWEDREGMSLAGHSQFLLLSAKVWAGQRLQLSGVRVEDKTMSLAIHFRNAPMSVIRDLRGRICDIVETLGPEGLHVIEGSNVLELLPPEIEGKGAVVRDILSGFPDAPSPIYLGDDASDESAFVALPTGITVRVGRARATAARYTLRDTSEVHSFLRRLEAKLS